MNQYSIAICDPHGDFVQVVDNELPIYSVAKPFIAAAIFELGVDIEVTLSDWFDQSLVPRGSEISVRQLLNHTSGLCDYGALPEYDEAVRSGQPPWSDEEFADRTLRQPLRFAPGRGWSYSNPGYWLLTQIIKQESGVSFDDAIRKLITDPLQLTSVHVAHGRFADDLPRYPAEWVWHGVLISNARDVVRFMRSEMVEPLLQGQTKVPVNHPLWKNPHHSCGLMVEPGVRYGHNGEGPNYSASCFHF
jgi:CubicO group peptidase (beta-lactamase class C family)